MPIRSANRLLVGMWTFLKFIALVLQCIAVCVGLLMVGVSVLIIGLYFGVGAIQNATYARYAFGPFYGIERVVASKRWHRSDEIFGCTYAVVELTPARSAELIAGNKFRGVFGKRAMYWEHPGNWEATPRNLPLQKGCYLEGMSNADKQAVLEGLNDSGGWAGAFSENVAFFLPKRNLIGIIRNGD